MFTTCRVSILIDCFVCLFVCLFNCCLPGIFCLGNIQKINVTVEVLPYNRACGFICLGVTWNEVTIKDDYRNVLFYTLSYRMA